MKHFYKGLLKVINAFPYVAFWFLGCEMCYAEINNILTWNGPFKGWTLHIDGVLSAPRWAMWEIMVVNSLVPLTVWYSFKAFCKSYTWLERQVVK